MRHLIVRHAHAGRRGSTKGDDQLRPLTKRGLGEADGITQLLAERRITAIWSSRAVRCVETVAPLAATLGLEVQHTPYLLEGAAPEETLAWLTSLKGSVVASSHGDVIGGLITLLAGDDDVQIDDPLDWPKASTWELKTKRRTVERARYLPPPGA